MYSEKIPAAKLYTIIKDATEESIKWAKNPTCQSDYFGKVIGVSKCIVMLKENIGYSEIKLILVCEVLSYLLGKCKGSYLIDHQVGTSHK